MAFAYEGAGAADRIKELEQENRLLRAVAALQVEYGRMVTGPLSDERQKEWSEKLTIDHDEQTGVYGFRVSE